MARMCVCVKCVCREEIEKVRVSRNFSY